ncbi:MAG: type II toxin-antitoxin system RelE/ParE family toxin [Candidatus Symbiobacter sp.]|nr:type II toxin-antitoxin system RelE/ParE family toxin [Candidatus Symbiobacter sp.]
MVWNLKFSSNAERTLEKLDRQIKRRIIEYFEKSVLTLENPRQKAEQLEGKLYSNFWKFRVGDYRLIDRIIDSELTILVVKLGHRSSIYHRNSLPNEMN